MTKKEEFEKWYSKVDIPMWFALSIREWFKVKELAYKVF